MRHAPAASSDDPSTTTRFSGASGDSSSATIVYGLCFSAIILAATFFDVFVEASTVTLSVHHGIQVLCTGVVTNCLPNICII